MIGEYKHILLLFGKFLHLVGKLWANIQLNQILNREKTTQYGLMQQA